MEHPPERSESLWMLTVAPVIWAAHLGLSYATSAVWCAKVVGPDGSLGTVRTAIGVYTAVALLGIALTGWRGLRRQREGVARSPRSADTSEDRHQFLGWATLLLSGLSAVATVYAALVALFFERCQ
jgi:hypothetical protein